MIFLIKKYKLRLAAGIISILLMLVFLSNWVASDNLYLGVYFKGMFAPLYLLLILLAFYLKDIFFIKRKFWQFFSSLLLVCIGASLVMDRIAPYFTDNILADWLVYFIGILFLIAIASFFRFMKEQLVNELDWADFKAKQNEAELKLLKQQLNPHFLFNTLNSVYARCLEDRAEAGDMVLQLSDLLRYQLENDNVEKKSINEELNFLDNYISFEKLRLPKWVQFVYEKNVDGNSMQIAPHILITLIENAFKHSARIEKECIIHITLQVADNRVALTTKNTFKPNADESKTKIGLENLKKRLDYLYPNAHVLTIECDDSIFSTSLIISL